MSELAGYLARQGHQVTVVTAFPNRPEGKLHKGYKLGLWMREKKYGYTIVRVPLYMTAERRSFKHRMLNHVSFMVTAIYGGLLAGRAEVVYFYSPPIFQGITAWALKKVYGAQTMMELNDLWPAAAISMGVIKNPTIRRLAEGFEKLVYRKTDHLSFYSEIHRQTIVDKGIARGKTEIHRLWVDTVLFCPSVDEQTRKAIRVQYQMGDRFAVMYAGKLGFAQGLDTVIEAAARLKDNPDIVFVLMGEGPEEERLKQMRADGGLENVLFIPYQPVEEVPQFLEAADVLYAQLAPAPHRLGTIPAKVLGYMSMGKPVLAAAEGETERLMKESEAGLCIPPNDVEALVVAVEGLYKDSDTRAMGERGRAYALKNFDRGRLLGELEQRLMELADFSRRGAKARRRAQKKKI